MSDIWAGALGDLTRAVRDTFPEAVVYTPAGGDAASITAVFDEAHEAVEFRDGQPVSTVQPTLWARLADLAAAPGPGDTVTLSTSGRTFEVVDVQPDGAGGATLRLLET